MTPWGGPREGGGRKSIYKGFIEKPYCMDFTPEGHELLDTIKARTGLSRNNILSVLAERHADELAFRKRGVEYPGKSGRHARRAMNIRVSHEAGPKLDAAKARTGKSFSDIGEALVRRFGRRAKFPPLPGKDRKRKRKA